MATRRTLDFLPGIFQTDTNRKFLSATLDQLISEPEFVRLNGYIGRKFAPTYKSQDSYVAEPSASRQNYQLEPGVVVKNTSNEIDFYGSYADLINKLGYYGAPTDNHDRLFASEYYAYSGLFDQDKFVNFQQYFWLPNGPESILISSKFVPSQATFTINRDAQDNCYQIDGKSDNNPEIVLSRGGLYKFVINQPGKKFYIQTEPGIAGTRRSMPNVSSRNIYGITGNGTDNGVIEFRVPLEDTQDVYLKMPMLAPIDYVLDTAMANLDGALWADVVANYSGFDGTDFKPEDKKVVFSTSTTDDSLWLRADGSTVAEEHRTGVWRVRVVKNTQNQDVLSFDYVSDVAVNSRVYCRLGRTNANKEFYSSATGYLPVPPLTAQLDTLYYQDSENADIYGILKLVTSATDTINVDTGILGKKNYTTPQGVEFTNGMLIEFDSQVEPASWANKYYIVEGVGKSIRLVDFDNLVFPEPGHHVNSVPWDKELFNEGTFDQPYKGPADPEYLTMNRSSLDLNAWARHNRWFHIDVIIKSAEHNGIEPKFDQAIRAQRPIIEFEPDVQLFNNGRIGKRPLDHIDTTHTNAFNQVQHQSTLLVNGVRLKEGQRILFANDTDPLVRQQVYRVEFKIQSESSYQSIYDGKGQGTISVGAPKLNFASVSVPELLSTTQDGIYEYSWVVSGIKDILTAVRIERLDWQNSTGTGTISEVVSLGNKQYQIKFSTDIDLMTFNDSVVELYGTGGVKTVVGSGNTDFLNELEEGTAIYVPGVDSDVLVGVVSAAMQFDRADLNAPALVEVSNSEFYYKHPRIQLIISEDSADVMEPQDTVVAKLGENKGYTFWFNGTSWIKGQLKNKPNQAVLFDAYDSEDNSFASYKGSSFAGTKIFSYKPGTGNKDAVLGFPIAYTTNYSIADITFDNNFGTDSFRYLVGAVFSTKKVELGYIRQNTNRNDFSKRNTWTPVNEPSRQYQVISGTYTGATNYFEIDVVAAESTHSPTTKVFLNNVLLNPSQYSTVAIGNRRAIKIQETALAVNDKIDILIYSNATSRLGHYEIPTNLDFNSKNSPFATLTLGQLRNNLTAVGKNANGINGSVPGDSNVRDLNLAGYGGNILQNSAPVIYSSIFLISEQANFMDGLDYARREYTKFKNKFLEMAASLKGLDHNNPKDGVDKILAAINGIKNKNFPWYYSDMVPYGDARVLSYRVLDTTQKQYKIASIFDDAQLQSRAVLVYINRRQLVKDVDFYFDKTRPAIQLNDSIVLTYNDIVEIKDYVTTDANFIPETPTKLGLYPKFVPDVFLDDTYRTPVNVIQGHDGSLTPSFGDFRDQYLLELEYRIYNNIKADASKVADVRTLVPGRFRNIDYSITEFNKILNGNFLKWAGSNKVDYVTNSYFMNGDPFSYNYRGTKDSLFKETLPGYWRGIYQYFYDTDKPHSHPWEMLGFTEMPNWWISVYGPSPYTSDNTLLWGDIESGMIRQGARAGVDSNYARPGLSKILPVDQSGELVSPMLRIATPLNTQTVEAGFQIGDVGPVEAAWRRTSEYPFALQAAAAIMKPAVYFGTLFDTSRYYKNVEFGQFMYQDTYQRVSPDAIVINGETVDSTVTRSSGYINWVVDYMTSTGIVGPTKLRSILSNLEVQLSYKAAGYTDKKYLTILAEQYSPTSINESVIIPDDSYTIYLNKGVPTQRIAYSAVIVTKTDTGYSVSGYNLGNPYFVIVPSETSGDKYSIKIDDFSAVIYKSFKNQKVPVPYGTEFNTRQQVVDFLISYQRYLIAQGFVLDEYDDNLSQNRDFVLSVKEFATWASQGWKAGNVLILSPVNDTLKVYTTNAVVDKITNQTNGSRLLDPNFNAIKTSDITVMRDQGDFKVISITGKTIAFAELNLVQYEHALIFNNTTIFNDIIYQPESGSRQFRLKLVGNKTANWDGSLNPAGFVYNSTQIAEWKSGKDYLKGDIVSYKNQYYTATQQIAATTAFNLNQWKQINKTDIKTGLLPNFAHTAGRFIDAYDVDSSLLDNQMALMSSGLIGFRSRNYLSDLNVNHTSQTKFYQGYIKEKGTGKSITNLLNATFNDLTNDIKYYEEWAVRVGEYGALNSSSIVEIVLNETTGKNNPAGLAIVGNYETAEDGIITVKDRDLWDRPYGTDPVKFINRPLNYISERDVQSAGYVNLDDIDATLFDANDYQNLNAKIADLSSGFLIWFAKDHNKDWNVYRATETDTTIDKLEYSLDQVAKITTINPHGLKAKQVIAFKNLDAGFDGFYVVNDVQGLREFTITVSSDQTKVLRQKTIACPPIGASASGGIGILFVLHTVRFNSPNDIDSFTPRHGWRDNDLVWVDHNVDDRWSVYKKQSVWNYDMSVDIQLGVTRPEINYGTTVKLTDQFLVIGAPSDHYGYGRIHVFDKEKTKEKGVLPTGIGEISQLGFSIDSTQDLIVAGAPDSYAQTGAVVVYKYQQNALFIPIQVIVPPTMVAGSQFGYSVSQSADAKWLYVGSPGENKTHIYRLEEYANAYNSYSLADVGAGLVVPYPVDDINSIAVYVNNNILTPEVDFYIDHNNRVRFVINVEEFLTEDESYILSEDGSTEIVAEATSTIQAVGSIVVARRSYYVYKTSVSQGSDLDQFGFSVKSSPTGDRVVIGAPGQSVGDTVQAGKSYVYTNSLANVPTVVQEQVLTSNEPAYRARFGSSLDYSAKAGSIYVGAPGHSTFAQSGGLVQRYEKTNAGYVVAQELYKPVHLAGENFGSYIKVSDDDRLLMVSSSHGTAQTRTVIDTKKTTFDGGATICLDITRGTGAVYLHDYMPAGTRADNPYGNFVFADEFNAPRLMLGDQFGCSLDFDKNNLYVGASYSDLKYNNAGAVYKQVNPTGRATWTISKQQKLSVDVGTINSISLYNKVSKSKIASLDYIDPAKGKLLGIVEQSLNHKSSQDPAMYNVGRNVADSKLVDFHWGAQQVGQTWWDLNTVRFVDYEQDTLIYRLNNWGKLFPGSTISVYEWIESILKPSEYVAAGNPGTPKDSDDSSYVQISYADSSSGVIKTKYYYWVSGISTVPVGSTRHLSILGIEDAIKNPKNQHIPYAAILADNSIGIFNCDQYITGSDTILKVDYDSVLNDNLIHSEFELIQEGTANSIMPARIVNKLVDSLAGADELLRRVPDAKLKSSQSLGMEIRPRQTLVKNKSAAWKNIAQFVNNVFAQTTSAYKLQNSEKFDRAIFFAAQPEPTEYNHLAANRTELGYVNLVAGETILISNDENFFDLWTLFEVQEDLSLKLLQNQTYKTPDLWSYATWYKEGFDPETVPDFIVDSFKDIEKLNPVAGNVVRVEGSSAGFEIYQFTSHTDVELMAVENGTLKLSDMVWDSAQNEVGFDNQGFEGAPFDRDRAHELRNILIGLKEDIFIDDLIENYNGLLFAVIHYILSEQQNVDWIFKTSFVSVLHKIKELAQYPNYIKDNHSYYEDYINEVKPYRTKLREYRIGYTGMDTAQTAVSDFDLPGYYDFDLARFRSPSGEYPTKDGALYTTPEYIDWAKNFTYSVESIAIADAGQNYSDAPQVKIVANGDGGTGATAEAFINEVTGKVTSIHVTNPGTGYRNTPYVIINGNGSDARGYALLSNNKIRSVKTVLKFDRIAYQTSVREWIPGIAYAAGDLVSYQGQGYRAKVANAGDVFNIGKFTLLSGNDYTSANDRLAATYYPGPNQIQKEFDAQGNINLSRLIPDITHEENRIIGNPSPEGFIVSPAAGDNATVSEPATINISGGTFLDQTKSYAPEELVAGTTFDSLNILVETKMPHSNPDHLIKYRILKNHIGETTYLAMSADAVTTLARDLHFGDTEIYLTNLSAIAMPNVAKKKPGIVYINGERIKFWYVDRQNNIIRNPSRGIDYTATPQVHPAGSVVEDQSPNFNVPETSRTEQFTFRFTQKNPVLVTRFTVSRDITVVKNKLEIYNGATKLRVDVDYTVNINDNSTASVTFTNAADIKNGVRFTAKYTEDLIWLNPGEGTATDGTGLEGSNTLPARFVKHYIHNLP